MNKPEFKITSNVGSKILGWCKEGVNEDAVKDMINRSNDIKSLREIFNSYPEFQILLNQEFQAKKQHILKPTNAKANVKSKANQNEKAKN